jgi:type IVB pilus formation R64 PilN family outer membrane protein
MTNLCFRVAPSRPWILAGIAVLLGGCSLAPQQQADRRIEAVSTLAERLRTENQQQASSSAVVRTHRPRLAGEELAVHPVDPLPEILARPLSYSTPGTQTLAEVLLAVSQLLGLRILAGEISQPGPPQAAAAQQPGAPTGPLTGRVQLEFINRPASSLLDEIAAQNDASWRYVGRTRTIEFFRFETRTLSVYLPPGAKNINASISLANVGGGSAGSSSATGAGASGGDVSVSQTLLVDPWSSIMGGIAALLSEGQGSAETGNAATTSLRSPGASEPTAHASSLSASGRAGRATANPELGIVTVTARPAAVERIAAYLQSINARFAQNVMVDVKIYSLTLDDRAAIGFSLDAVYRRLGRYAVSLVGPAPGQIGSTPGQLTISSEGARSNGSELIVQALSQFGNVALQTQGQVIAINGQPSPIQVANEVNYLASSATTTAANVGTTTTLQPGTRVVGFTANFLPLILGDNRILLQYQMQISQLTALTQVLSGNASIQTPQISSQSLQQQAFVQDGQSIVLFGFDQHRDTTERSLGLGGASKTGTAQRQMIVIVLQVNGGRKHDA